MSKLSGAGSRSSLPSLWQVALQKLPERDGVEAALPLLSADAGLRASAALLVLTE